MSYEECPPPCSWISLGESSDAEWTGNHPKCASCLDHRLCHFEIWLDTDIRKVDEHGDSLGRHLMGRISLGTTKVRGITAIAAPIRD